MKKRVFALLLAACIAVGLMLQFPVTAMAATVALPTANAENLSGIFVKDQNNENVKMDFAMKFTSIYPTPEQIATYENWYADFVLTVSADVHSKDGYLGGQYDWFGSNWLVFKDDTNYGDDPATKYGPVMFEANKPVPIIQTFCGLLGYEVGQIPYSMIYDIVEEFQCGLSFNEDFWNRNPDATIQLALKLYPPKGHPDEGKSFVVGDNYVFVEGATGPHVCMKSNWQKTPTNHYKKECVYTDCPLKGNLKFFDQSAHTFGGDNTCTICGYIGSEETAAPKTGDTTHTLLWATLFVGGVAMMWMQLNARKREMF